MELRLASVADAEAIRTIYNAEVIGSTATFDLRPRTLQEQEAWIRDHQGVHPAVVAVMENAVAGFGSLSVYRDRPAYSTTVEDSVYVDARWQGRGIGRRVLDELVTLATRQGFHTVMARIAGDNQPSIRLHAACGFSLVGVEREVGRKFGHWLDVTVMQRML
jgi:phosphinothricin acetyltransferase